ncbi:MAG TPA: hypothetical protein VG755_23795, partial [Nannocystaceae bacterium]|nr:hypothetical protein [Nannocystaceae bacterium]
MKLHRLVLALPLCACASPAKQEGSAESNSGIGTLTTAGTDGTGGSGSEGGGTGNGPAGSADESGDATSPGTGPKFDTEDPGFCAQRDDGIYCNNDNIAITCADHDQADQQACDPHYCVEGTGCVDCLDGQFTCMGDTVMSCNGAANPPSWQLVEVCDPAGGEACDLAVGACVPAVIIGTNVPTGEYYQFAEFATGSTAFLGGYDVDSYDDKLYVLGGNLSIDVYQVTLLDSDADGILEPNQHPLNPDNTGAIEQRTIAYVETIPQFGTPAQSVSEVLALGDRVYLGGSQLNENVLGVGVTQISSPPGWF